MRNSKAAKFTLIICLGLLLAACDRSIGALPNEDCRELLRLHSDHAAEDARQAIARGDQRLIGLYGVAEYFPGVPETIRPKREKARFVACTSDEIYSHRHERLIRNAEHYAAVYNRVLLSRWGDKLTEPVILASG